MDAGGRGGGRLLERHVVLCRVCTRTKFCASRPRYEVTYQPPTLSVGRRAPGFPLWSDRWIARQDLALLKNEERQIISSPMFSPRREPAETEGNTGGNTAVEGAGEELVCGWFDYRESLGVPIVVVLLTSCLSRSVFGIRQSYLSYQATSFPATSLTRTSTATFAPHGSVFFDMVKMSRFVATRP